LEAKAKIALASFNFTLVSFCRQVEGFRVQFGVIVAVCVLLLLLLAYLVKRRI